MKERKCDKCKIEYTGKSHLCEKCRKEKKKLHSLLYLERRVIKIRKEKRKKRDLNSLEKIENLKIKVKSYERGRNGI